MKKYFDDLQKEIGNVTFEIIKNNIDDYKEKIIEEFVNSKDFEYEEGFMIKVLPEHREKTIEKLYNEYSEIIIFDQLDSDGLRIIPSGEITFEFENKDEIIVLNDHEYIFSISLNTKEGFNNFIKNLWIATVHAESVYFEGEYMFDPMKYKAYYEELPADYRLLIETEYPELSCSDDEVRRKIMEKLGNHFTQEDINIIKEYLK